MKRIRFWSGAIAAATLCAACHHQAKMSTMGGSVAPAGGQSYNVQVWTGNKQADLPFPTQRVAMSLRWAESDEGIASWNEGFASNTQAHTTVHTDHSHGMLRSIRVTLAGDPTQTGPALVIDSVAVTSTSGGPHYVCVGGAAAASVRPGSADELHCRRE